MEEKTIERWRQYWLEKHTSGMRDGTFGKMFQVEGVNEIFDLAILGSKTKAKHADPVKAMIVRALRDMAENIERSEE